MNVFNPDELNASSEPVAESQKEIELNTITEILRNVYDPELGINIIDLGLVYGITSDEARIEIVMTMTTPGCPMHESIVAAAERALRAFYPTRTIDVQLVWEPPWSMARLSAQAHAQLSRY
jgi:metal-sulfur cluster biosynthetic enzyme